MQKRSSNWQSEKRILREPSTDPEALLGGAGGAWVIEGTLGQPGLLPTFGYLVPCPVHIPEIPGP